MNTGSIEQLIETEVAKRVAARAPQPTGNRVVLVLDRGWIFAGDLTRANGRLKLTRAVHVWRFERVGFNGMIDDPSKAVIKPCADVDAPEESELFCVPVPDDWGLT